MSETTPVHDFLSPRLAALVDEAVQFGFDRAAVVAVLIDLVTSPPYDEPMTDLPAAC